MEHRLRTHKSAIVIAALALTVGVTWAERQQQQQEKARRPLPRVTSLSELRAQSAEDRAAAVLFDDDYHSEEPIRRGSDRRRYPGDPVPSPPPGVPEPSYDAVIRDLVCEADAVITGEATLDRVLLNSQSTFMFTKYAVQVQSWIHPAGRQAPQMIPVYAPGGEVEVAGRPTSVNVGFSHLEPATTYVLILRRVPGVGGYALARRPIVDGNDLAKVTRNRFVPEAIRQGQFTLNQVVSDLTVASQTCTRSR